MVSPILTSFLNGLEKVELGKAVRLKGIGSELISGHLSPGNTTTFESCFLDFSVVPMFDHFIIGLYFKVQNNCVMNGALSVGEEILDDSVNRITSSEANISSVKRAGFAKYSNCFVCLGQGSMLSVDPATKVDFQTSFIGAKTAAKNGMPSHSDWSPTTVLILKQVDTIRRCANFPMMVLVSEMSERSWVSCYTSAEISIQRCKKEIFATWLAWGTDPLVAGCRSLWYSIIRFIFGDVRYVIDSSYKDDQSKKMIPPCKDPYLGIAVNLTFYRLNARRQQIVIHRDRIKQGLKDFPLWLKRHRHSFPDLETGVVSPCLESVHLEPIMFGNIAGLHS